MSGGGSDRGTGEVPVRQRTRSVERPSVVEHMPLTDSLQNLRALGSLGRGPLPPLWRWVMLFILVYSTTVSVLTLQGFSSISIDAAQYYDCSEIMINTLVTVSNAAQIAVALIWTMNLESTHGLQIPYVLGAMLLVGGGWLSYYGKSPTHSGLFFVFLGVSLSSAGATFLCTLPVPLSARWFPYEERTFATAIGAMAAIFGYACAYVLQAVLHKDIPGFLLLNAILSTTTLPLAPLFRDPPDRDRALGIEKDKYAEKSAPLDNGRINTILWLTDWRVALLLIGSTYILGLGLTFLTLIDEVLPPDIRDIKTILAIVFLFSGMTGMVAIGSFVDATREYISTLRGVLGVLTFSYVVMSVAWQYSLEALLYASTSLVAATTFAVMPVALEVAVELTYGHGVELEGAINSWIAVIGSSIWNSVTIYVADPNMLGVPLMYTGWLWLAYAMVGVVMLVPVEGRLHRMEEEMRKRAISDLSLDKPRPEVAPLAPGSHNGGSNQGPGSHQGGGGSQHGGSMDLSNGRGTPTGHNQWPHVSDGRGTPTGHNQWPYPEVHGGGGSSAASTSTVSGMGSHGATHGATAQGHAGSYGHSSAHSGQMGMGANSAAAGAARSLAFHGSTGAPGPDQA